VKNRILEKLVKKALQDLQGDWVVIGGTVLPLVGVEYRTTVDIDMIPMHDKGNESMLALMELADAIGLPVEAINSAGLFFLKKIPDWKKRLVLQAESKKCRIYRPNFDLYLELKISRFSESDESDIDAYLKWHQEQKIGWNSEQAAQILKRAIKKAKDEDQVERLQKMQKRLIG
jgi:hypothetical protein